mmetsp:Transcript_72450/g.143632  ORF Transcript_72450/g.143632 Transcript_72450/m.143632 type:complete len:207 (+) Transcript_72450:360-980(+)
MIWLITFAILRIPARIRARGNWQHVSCHINNVVTETVGILESFPWPGLRHALARRPAVGLRGHVIQEGGPMVGTLMRYGLYLHSFRAPAVQGAKINDLPALWVPSASTGIRLKTLARGGVDKAIDAGCTFGMSENIVHIPQHVLDRIQDPHHLLPRVRVCIAKPLLHQRSCTMLLNLVNDTGDPDPRFCTHLHCVLVALSCQGLVH